MRVYLPVTLPLLAGLHARDEVTVPVGHAVTPALREWYADGDTEELEYAALLDAATACLRLLAADGTAPRRRVVLAADVGERDAVPDAAAGAPSAVRLTAAVPRRRVVSVHVDGSEAEPDVAAAVAAVPAADAGDDDAAFTVSGAQGHDLLWYDVTEIPDLLDGR